jgi:hypothetical protein
MPSAKPRVRLSTGFIFQQTPCESVIPSEVAGQTVAEVVEKKPTTPGRPRQTDSLCPDCEKEARNAIIHGKKEWRDLMREKVGGIMSQILEREWQVLMVEDCPIHGHFEDVMALDLKFFSWIEQNSPKLMISIAWTSGSLLHLLQSLPANPNPGRKIHEQKKQTTAELEDSAWCGPLHLRTGCRLCADHRHHKQHDRRGPAGCDPLPSLLCGQCCTAAAGAV